MQLNIHLSQGQAAFALMLERAPYLQQLWNLDEREYLPDVAEQYLATASHGQAIMARFFLMVWRHRNDFGFDIVDAAAVLDQEQMKIITDWLSHPFWP